MVALIAQGLSNQEIADRAFLTINSVKTYIRSAYRKIGVERRTQAVLWATQNGFVPTRARLSSATHDATRDPLPAHPDRGRRARRRPAETLAAIDNAAHDGVAQRRHTGRTFLLECQDRDGEGPDAGVWLGARG